LILYFGLFYNKKNPDGLDNRFSQEVIKRDIKEVKSNFYRISNNLKQAQAESLQVKSLQTANSNSNNKNLKIINCGDLVNIKISFIDQKNVIAFLGKITAEIGKMNYVKIEKQIIGLKENDSIFLKDKKEDFLKIYSQFNKEDSLKNFLNYDDIQYFVQIDNIEKNNLNKEVSCKF
jgi:hypothetical protein